MESDDFYCDFVLNNKTEVQREIETEHVLAFRHTEPSWEFHVVIIPKEHISKLSDVNDPNIIGQFFKLRVIVNALVLR